MMKTSKVTRKYQTTIPRAVVEALGVKPSDRLEYEIEDGRVTLRARAGRIADLWGKFDNLGKRPRRPLTIDEINQGIAEGAAESGMGGLTPHPRARPRAKARNG